MASWNTVSEQFKVSAIWREECVSLLFVLLTEWCRVDCMRFVCSSNKLQEHPFLIRMHMH